MKPSEILHALAHAEGLPREALKAADERRAEMASLFVEEIERYLVAPAADRARPTPFFFIFHLLGDWKEKSAYRPLARFLRCPSHELDAQIGDAPVSTAHRVMAAVFDGDPQPLFDIVLDPAADEFIRSRMCEALAMVALRGEADRGVVVRFLRDCFMNIEPQAECYVWNGWQSAIAMLGLSDLRPIVKKAFDRGFISPQTLSFRHFEEDLEWGIAHPGEPRRPEDREYVPFGDTIAELSAWYGFSDKYKEDRERRQRQPEEDHRWATLTENRVNPHRKIGRNDLCPCGSGKKYKKCCLQ